MTLSHIPKRTTIPRDTGLTMMMDKGLSTRQMEDFLSTCARYTDIIKFGFGTSIVSNNIQEKVSLMNQVGIKPYFGGTMFELYYARKQEAEYFKIVDDFGIETIDDSRKKQLASFLKDAMLYLQNYYIAHFLHKNLRPKDL